MSQQTEQQARPGRSVEGEVEIGAPIARVWQALTEARELERWFPLEAKVEPGEGGSMWMSWRNEYAGASRILAWEPPGLLRTTWGELDGAGHVQVTEYRLEEKGRDRTVLRVVTSGFPPDASWDEWVEGTRLGWLYELRSLRHYLEHHAGQDRRVAYVRRRVGIPAQEAWSRLLGDGGLDARWRDGRLVCREPDRLLALAVDEPANALLRLSVDPTVEIGRDTRDVTLWLSVWGDAATEQLIASVEREWRSVLDRIYPEGSTV